MRDFIMPFALFVASHVAILSIILPMYLIGQ